MAVTNTDEAPPSADGFCTDDLPPPDDTTVELWDKRSLEPAPLDYTTRINRFARPGSVTALGVMSIAVAVLCGVFSLPLSVFSFVLLFKFINAAAPPKPSAVSVVPVAANAALGASDVRAIVAQLQTHLRLTPLTAGQIRAITHALETADQKLVPPNMKSTPLAKAVANPDGSFVAHFNSPSGSGLNGGEIQISPTGVVISQSSFVAGGSIVDGWRDSFVRMSVWSGAGYLSTRRRNQGASPIACRKAYASPIREAQNRRSDCGKYCDRCRNVRDDAMRHHRWRLCRTYGLFFRARADDRRLRVPGDGAVIAAKKVGARILRRPQREVLRWNAEPAPLPDAYF